MGSGRSLKGEREWVELVYILHGMHIIICPLCVLMWHLCLQGLYLWVCKDAPQEYVSQILDVKHFGAIPEIMVSMVCFFPPTATIVLETKYNF